MAEQSETLSNQPLRFSIPTRDARGRLVRLDDVLAEILAAHAYPPVIERILAEALFGVFGQGYLAITFDRMKPASEGGGRYQGIVPLEGETLADAAQNYFMQSEQIPTFIRVAVDRVDGRCVAGGLLVQHLPEGEEGRERLHVRLDHPEWAHIEVMSSTIAAAELADPALPLEEIVWRLFHEEQEVRIEQGDRLSKGCRCDPVHIRDVIAKFPPEDRAEMADDDGDIVVDCEFCSRRFPISLASFNN